MPGKGLGTAAKRIGAAAARPALKGKKMDFIKKQIAPMKKRDGAPMKKDTSMPLEKLKTKMPLKNVPAKKLKPEFMKPGYKPGSIMRGYTKYA